MEKSRYQENRKLFLMGMILMVTGLFSVGVGLYLIPFVMFNNINGIPLFVFEFINWLQDTYGMTPSSGAWSIWGFFVMFGVICFVVAELISNHIDNQLLELNPDDLKTPVSEEQRQKSQESRKTFFFVFIAVGTILVVLKLVDWMLSTQS